MKTRDEVSEILQVRCGIRSIVTLEDGQWLEVHNIAWGRDMGAICDHITTNISPAPDCPHTIDFFHSSEVVCIEAPELGVTLYRRAVG